MSHADALTALPAEEFKEQVLNLVGFFERDESDPDKFDLRGYPSSAAAMFLARNAVDQNANFYRITLGHYTVSDVDKGDWEITVRKLTPRLLRWRRFQEWLDKVRTLHYKKVWGMKSDDILNMDNSPN